MDDKKGFKRADKNTRTPSHYEERLCRWKFKFLCSNANFIIDNPKAIDYLECKGEIDLVIERCSPNQREIINFMNELSVIDVLPDSEFDWIDINNERFYKWLDGYLVQRKPPVNKLSKSPTLGTTAKTYRKDIINYFDSLNYSANEQMGLIYYLKNEWNAVYYYENNFNWLDRDDLELHKWALNYLQARNINQNGIYIQNDSEIYSVVIAMLDAWEAHSDTKKLFIVNMKKALSQKKQRDKLDGKKAYNIVMSVDVKEKLNTLAKHYDMKINQTLESIISSEYEKISRN